MRAKPLVYRACASRIRRGEWRVDCENGVLLGMRDCPIGYGSPDGYRRVSVWCGDRVKRAMVHRVIWEAVHGEITDDSLQINHLNGRKDDNRLANLELTTCGENHVHAFRTGLRSHRGERNTLAKLTDRDVLAIRALLSSGEMTGRAIAKRFGIAESRVSVIKKGTAWSHV